MTKKETINVKGEDCQLLIEFFKLNGITRQSAKAIMTTLLITMNLKDDTPEKDFITCIRKNWKNIDETLCSILK